MTTTIPIHKEKRIHIHLGSWRGSECVAIREKNRNVWTLVKFSPIRWNCRYGKNTVLCERSLSWYAWPTSSLCQATADEVMATCQTVSAGSPADSLCQGHLGSVRGVGVSFVTNKGLPQWQRLFSYSCTVLFRLCPNQ